MWLKLVCSNLKSFIEASKVVGKPSFIYVLVRMCVCVCVCVCVCKMSVLRHVQATATQDGTLTYYEISLNTVHGLHKDRYPLLCVLLE